MDEILLMEAEEELNRVERVMVSNRHNQYMTHEEYRDLLVERTEAQKEVERLKKKLGRHYEPDNG